MLIVFKSDAAADVIMFGEVAKKLIAAIGKDPEASKGIITVAQLPEAAARLRVLIEEEKARAAAQPEEDEADAREAGRSGIGAPVNLAQRAWPLLEMLEYSIKEGVPVVWGV